MGLEPILTCETCRHCTCKNCRHWTELPYPIKDWRVCVYLSGIRHTAVARIRTGSQPTIETHEEFGCNCWEAQTPS